MLCLHKIELHKNGTRLPLPLIPHEVVADITKANQLLEHAKAQAHELRRLTEEECKTLLKKPLWKSGNERMTNSSAGNVNMKKYLKVSNTMQA